MYLLRHGQSYFNLHFTPTRIDPGIEDPELTELGLAQANAAAAQLKDVRLTRMVVSPYMRALQTAEPMLKLHQVPVEIMQEVRERAAFTCDVGIGLCSGLVITELSWLRGRNKGFSFMYRTTDWAEVTRIANGG
jgi:phosphohistidine phosphatase SixA